jgi:CRP-like cAMP-binding protein
MAIARTASLEGRLLLYIRAHRVDRLSGSFVELATLEDLSDATGVDQWTCSDALAALIGSEEVRVIPRPGGRLELLPRVPCEPSDAPGIRGGASSVTRLAGALKRYPRGALLAVAGEPADAIYVVSRGYVRAYQVDEEGRETTVAVLGPEHLVGIGPLLRRPRYHAFAEALTSVEARSIPVHRLVERLSDDPGLLEVVQGALGRRLALAEELLQDLRLPMRERIPQVLGHLQDFLGARLPPLTHEQLGNLVGAKRETVTRVLAPLEEQGRIRREGRRILVCKTPHSDASIGAGWTR